MQWRNLLVPLTPLYHTVVSARICAYQRGLLPSHRLPLPVISVGNLSFGGTGKTPTTISLVRDLIERGQKPAVLTRGYGRSSAEPLVVIGEDHGFDAATAGDEPLEMAARLPATPIIVDKNRVRGGHQAITLGATILVLDDGFQHLRLERDVDIVLIDAGDPWGGGRLPPLGRLREPLAALKRASIVVITKLPSDGGKKRDEISTKIHSIAPDIPIISCELRPYRVRINGKYESPDHLRGAHVIAFAGLGRPQGFISVLKEAGANIREQVFFNDHHNYSTNDEIDLQARAAETDCIAVTTCKDAVKLSSRFDPWVVEVEMKPTNGTWDQLWSLFEVATL